MTPVTADTAFLPIEEFKKDETGIKFPPPGMKPFQDSDGTRARQSKRSEEKFLN
jgi:hypothetical protein